MVNEIEKGKLLADAFVEKNNIQYWVVCGFYLVETLLIFCGAGSFALQIACSNNFGAWVVMVIACLWYVLRLLNINRLVKQRIWLQNQTEQPL